MGALLSFVFPKKPAIDYDHTLYLDRVEWDSLEEQKIPFPQGADKPESLRNVCKWTPTSTSAIGIVLICHGLYEHG